MRRPHGEGDVDRLDQGEERAEHGGEQDGGDEPQNEAAPPAGKRDEHPRRDDRAHLERAEDRSPAAIEMLLHGEPERAGEGEFVRQLEHVREKGGEVHGGAAETDPCEDPPARHGRAPMVIVPRSRAMPASGAKPARVARAAWPPYIDEGWLRGRSGFDGGEEARDACRGSCSPRDPSRTA